MRLISTLFIIFLSLYSYSVFSQDPPQPTCAAQTNLGCMSASFLAEVSAACVNEQYGAKGYFSPKPCAFPIEGYQAGTCKTQCTCPEGSSWYTGYDQQGAPVSGCVLDVIDETPPDDCPSGYPRVNGQCPVCIGAQNPDGTCVDDSGGSSAANSSSPASSPDTGSSGSAASNGGGGDDGDPDGPQTGGGGGNNNGSNTNGGASASAAASSSPSGVNNSSGSASSSGNASSFSGQCDPTSKNYLSCISSQKITPEGDIPWVPISGYGNWIPIDADSPCPNKFKDAEGNWWCSGGGSGGSGGAGGSSGSAGSAASASGKCDSTSEDYLKCISGQLSSGGSASSASSLNSSSGSSRSGAYSSLGEKGEFDEELHEKKLEDLTKELEDKIADIKDDVAAQVGGTISGSGGIQDFCKNIRGNDVCFGMKKFQSHLEPISSAIFLVCCVLAFVIVLRN